MAIKLKASLREDFRGSATKKLRKSGQVPAVVYGKGEEARSISIDSLELVKTVRDEGRNAIISLDIENSQPLQVMLHEYQMHAVREELVHVDFYKVDLTEEMNVQVPVRIEGEPEGARSGGILQQPLFELQVRAKPNDIPDEIKVDVASLEIGDSITVGDLPTSNKYEFLDEADTPVVTILPPEAEEEEVEDADTTIEPELVDAEEGENKE